MILVSSNTTDSLFSKCIRLRDGRCIAEGYISPTGFEGCSHDETHQAAHIYSRSYRSMRWNPLNCICLCASHHMYFTKAPLEWQSFLVAALGEPWMEELMELKRGHSRIKIPKCEEKAFREYFRKVLDELQTQRNEGNTGVLTFKPFQPT